MNMLLCTLSLEVAHRFMYRLYHCIKNTSTLGAEQMINYDFLQKVDYYKALCGEV